MGEKSLLLTQHNKTAQGEKIIGSKRGEHLGKKNNKLFES